MIQCKASYDLNEWEKKPQKPQNLLRCHLLHLNHSLFSCSSSFQSYSAFCEQVLSPDFAEELRASSASLTNSFHTSSFVIYIVWDIYDACYGTFCVEAHIIPSHQFHRVQSAVTDPVVHVVAEERKDGKSCQGQIPSKQLHMSGPSISLCIPFILKML